MRRSNKAKMLLVATAAAVVTLVLVPAGNASAAKVVGGLDGILSHDGEPVSGDIVVIAWPSASVLKTLKDGETVPTRVVAQSHIGKGGAFSLKVASDAAADLAVNGLLDVQLVAADATREVTWFFSQQLDEAQVVNVDVGTSRESVQFPSKNPTSSIDDEGNEVPAGTLRASQIVSSIKSAGTAELLRQAEVGGDASAMQSAVAAPPSCGVYVASTWRNNRPEAFLKVFGWSGAKATVTESTGTSHTLGIAFNTDGNGWAASAGQTSTLSTSDEREQPDVVDATARNRVNYRDFKNPAGCNDIITKPIELAGLIPTVDFVYAPHQDFNGTCVSYTGGHYAKKTGTNVTYASGMDVGPISVSAQAGYTTSTKVNWKFTKPSLLCANSTSVVTASQLSARKA